MVTTEIEMKTITMPRTGGGVLSSLSNRFLRRSAVVLGLLAAVVWIGFVGERAFDDMQWLPISVSVVLIIVAGALLWLTRGEQRNKK